MYRTISHALVFGVREGVRAFEPTCGVPCLPLTRQVCLRPSETTEISALLDLLDRSWPIRTFERRMEGR